MKRRSRRLARSAHNERRPEAGGALITAPKEHHNVASQRNSQLFHAACGNSRKRSLQFTTASPSIHAIGDRNSCRCDRSQRLPFVSFSSRSRDISNFAEREIYRNCRGEYRGNYIERRSAPYIDRPRRLARSAFSYTKSKENRDGCVFETARTKNECALTSFPNEVLCRAFLQESARPLSRGAFLTDASVLRCRTGRRGSRSRARRRCRRTRRTALRSARRGGLFPRLLRARLARRSRRTRSGAR